MLIQSPVINKQIVLFMLRNILESILLSERLRCVLLSFPFTGQVPNIIFERFDERVLVQHVIVDRIDTHQPLIISHSGFLWPDDCEQIRKKHLKKKKHVIADVGYIANFLRGQISIVLTEVIKPPDLPDDMHLESNDVSDFGGIADDRINILQRGKEVPVQVELTSRDVTDGC
jgi:hypothetical protein